MVFILKITLVIFSISLTVVSVGQNNNLNKSSIEIYLLKDSFQINQKQPEFNYYMPAKEELSDSAFIQDCEILGYEIKDDTSKYKSGKFYAFILANSAVEKINRLENIPLCCGLKFAIVVNKYPVFGAYFWNTYSSFGCNWLATFAESTGKLRLHKGLPYFFYIEGHKDPRDSKDLIDALKISGRLINK